MTPEELDVKLRSLIEKLRQFSTNVPIDDQHFLREDNLGEEFYKLIHEAQQAADYITELRSKLQQLPDDADDEIRALNKRCKGAQAQLKALFKDIRSRFQTNDHFAPIEYPYYAKVYQGMWTWCTANISEFPIVSRGFVDWFNQKLTNRLEVYDQQQVILSEIHEILEQSGLLWKPKSNFNEQHYAEALRRRWRWFDEQLWQKCPEKQSVVQCFNEALERSYCSVDIDEELDQIIQQAQRLMAACRQKVDKICQKKQETAPLKTTEITEFLFKCRREELPPDVSLLVREAGYYAKEFSKKFGELIARLEDSGKIWRAGLPRDLRDLNNHYWSYQKQRNLDAYAEALKVTIDWFREDLEDRYSKEKATFQTRFNNILKYRYKDELRKIDDHPEFPFDPQAGNYSNEEEDSSVFDVVDDSNVDFEDREILYVQVFYLISNWACQDKGNLRKHMRQPIDSTKSRHSAQTIILEFLEKSQPSEILTNLTCPDHVLNQLAPELEVSFGKLKRFWQRSCYPAIMDFLRNRKDFF